jgi:hypothetical protein
VYDSIVRSLFGNVPGRRKSAPWTLRSTLKQFQLSAGTGYTSPVAPGVITGCLAGNSFAGISGKFDLNFVTAIRIIECASDNPQLIWCIPVR